MTRPVFRCAALFLAGAVLALTQTANAQSFLPNDVTINTSLNSYAYVGYANRNDLNTQTHGTSPTVSLVDGGMIGGSLLTYNSSTVNVSGGSVAFGVFTYDSSTINMTGGSLETSLQAFNNSALNVSGGNIGSLVVAQGNSRFYLSNGTVVGGLQTYNTSTAIITGGSIGNIIDTEGSSTLTITSGIMLNSLSVTKNGTVNLFGGSIKGDLYVGGFDTDTSRLNLFGTGLSDTLIVPAFPDVYRSQYVLSGILRDGTSVNGKTLYVWNNSGVQVNFINDVPEPGSVAMLLSIAGTGLLARKRLRHK